MDHTMHFPTRLSCLEQTSFESLVLDLSVWQLAVLRPYGRVCKTDMASSQKRAEGGYL